MIFKVAVELGKLSHMTAAMNDVDEETLKCLHAMCVTEVRKINGIIVTSRYLRKGSKKNLKNYVKYIATREAQFQQSASVKIMWDILLIVREL